MVNNHMYWFPSPTDQDKGDLYAASPTGKIAGLPSFSDLTFTESVELVTIFPPRTAIRRMIDPYAEEN